MNSYTNSFLMSIPQAPAAPVCTGNGLDRKASANADHSAAGIWEQRSTSRPPRTVPMCPQPLPLPSLFRFPSPCLQKLLPALSCADNLWDRSPPSSQAASSWINHFFLTPAPVSQVLAFKAAGSWTWVWHYFLFETVLASKLITGGLVYTALLLSLLTKESNEHFTAVKSFSFQSCSVKEWTLSTYH